MLLRFKLRQERNVAISPLRGFVIIGVCNYKHRVPTGLPPASCLLSLNQSFGGGNQSGLVAFERGTLLLLISAIAHDQVVEVHLMAVELRPIHTGEAGLAGDRDATAAAHSRAVNHYRVETDVSFHLVAFGRL